LRVRPHPAGSFTVVASRRHSSPAQERLLDSLRGRFGELSLANVGSSLKFCLLAEGSADCYPRLAPGPRPAVYRCHHTRLMKMR